MNSVTPALLAANYCMRKTSGSLGKEVGAAYKILTGCLKSYPAIDSQIFDRLLGCIESKPDSAEALRALRKIERMSRYAGHDAELHAQELMDTVKQVEDGHYYIAQAEIHVMSKKRKTILICEDMRDFREAFVNNHKDEYNVIALDKLEYVQPVLAYCEKHRSFPDLLVLDLHWPRDEDHSAIGSARQTVKQAIEKHKKQVVELRNIVFQHLEPCAIGELVRIRKLYQSSRLPILMYTRAGALTLDDPDVEVIYGNDADFLPKHRPAHVERQKIRYYVELKLPWWKKPPSDINWRVFFLTLGFSASAILNIVLALLRS